MSKFGKISRLPCIHVSLMCSPTHVYAYFFFFLYPCAERPVSVVSGISGAVDLEEEERKRQQERPAAFQGSGFRVGDSEGPSTLVAEAQKTNTKPVEKVSLSLFLSLSLSLSLFLLHVRSRSLVRYPLFFHF